MHCTGEQTSEMRSGVMDEKIEDLIIYNLESRRGNTRM